MLKNWLGSNPVAEMFLSLVAPLPGWPICDRFRAWVLRTAGAKVGHGCRLGPHFHGKNFRLLQIGEACSFNRNVSLQASNEARIIFGRDCLIGENTVFRSAGHNFENREIPIKKQGNTGKEICIGNDVWIGANVVVVPGVKIGDGAVIGAGAVVTGEIPSMGVAVGVPARVLRVRGDK